MSTSLIVVNYNTPQEAMACVESCRDGVDECIIVNNGPDPAYGKNALIVCSATPRLSAAINAGVSASRGDVLIVLNPDVTLSAVGCRRLAMSCASVDVGLVAPTLLNEDGSPQGTLRPVPTLTEIAKRRILRRRPSEDRPAATYALGAAFCMRREVFEKIGGVDERFTLYFEDVDLSLTLKAFGYRVVEDGGVLAVHKYRRASRRWFSRAFWLHMVSALKFFWKWRHRLPVVPRQST